MAMTDAKCRSLKPKDRLYKESDGNGLQLWIFPNGSRLWRWAYRWGAKQKVIAFGKYPEVGLAEARERRDDARQRLREGRDPAMVRREAKARRAGAISFGELAEEFFQKQTNTGKAPATLKKLRWHIDHAKRRFGTVPVQGVTASDVLAAARVFESRGNFETANRFRGTAGSIFRYGIATARCSSDPTVGLRGALIRKPCTPRAAILDPKKLGALLRAIPGSHSNSVVKAALECFP